MAKFLEGAFCIFVLAFHVCPFPGSNSCKFPSKIANFVWNPEKIDSAGYFLPLASPDSISSSVLLPGSVSTSNCVPRFSASSTSPLTIYTADCGNHLFIFKCSPIGGKEWILDCKHDTSIVSPSKGPTSPPSPVPTSSTSAPPPEVGPSESATISFPPLPATLSTPVPTFPTFATSPGLPCVVSVGALSNGTVEASCVPRAVTTIDIPTTTTMNLTSDSPVSNPHMATPDPILAPTEAPNEGVDLGAGISPPPGNRYPIWCFWCWPTEKRLRVRVPREDVQDFSHTVITSLTDHKTYGFMNRCFYKLGQYDWIVFSTMMDLPAATKIEIMSHGNSLGYSTTATTAR